MFGIATATLPSEVMTILRHPVERALSLYKFTHNAQRLLPLDREGHWDGKCSG